MWRITSFYRSAPWVAQAIGVLEGRVTLAAPAVTQLHSRDGDVFADDMQRRWMAVPKRKV